MAEEPMIVRVGKLGAKEEVGEFVGQLSAKALVLTLLVIIVGIVMFFRAGLALRATILVAGGILSITGLIGFNRTVIQRAATGGDQTRLGSDVHGVRRLSALRPWLLPVLL